jgi:glycerophosphoryl diester phosphodiesterase
MSRAAGRPLLYAHRGAASEQPENTLPSFRRAVAIGADVLETDVHLTRDGHVVVSHDPTGGRMAGVPREIRHSTLAEVERWDAGHGFVDAAGDRPFAGHGIRFPTFAELLVEFPDMRLNVDLKQREPSMVEPLLALLRRHDAEHRVTIASFYDDVLREVRRRGYPGATALGRFEVLELLALPRWVRFVRKVAGTAAQLPCAIFWLPIDRRWVIERCHALGLRVDYWTVNDVPTAERLLDLGADGIMTDDPARLAPLFTRRFGPPTASARRADR